MDAFHPDPRAIALDIYLACGIERGDYVLVSLRATHSRIRDCEGSLCDYFKIS